MDIRAMRAAKRIALALFGLLLVSPAEAVRQSVEVVDGDTVRANGVLIRIVGLNTPETRGAKCALERRLGERATARMRQLVDGGVFIEPVARRDRYGRTLAVIRTPSGQDVASIMIAEGLAEPYNGRGQRRNWCPS